MKSWNNFVLNPKETVVTWIFFQRSISRRRSAKTTRRKRRGRTGPIEGYIRVCRVCECTRWPGLTARRGLQCNIVFRPASPDGSNAHVVFVPLSSPRTEKQVLPASSHLQRAARLLFAVRPVSFFTASNTRRPRWTGFLKTSPRTKGTSMDLSYSYLAKFRY